MPYRFASSGRLIAAAGSLALLVGCGSAEDDIPQPTPTPETTGVQASIMRDDLAETSPLPPPPLSPLDARIGFGEGGAELSESATADLDTLLASPQVKAGGPIVLRAHSDASGPAEANQRASQARGETVSAYLVEGGVAEDRITLIAFGEQNPIRPNAKPDGTPNEPGRVANRRVDIHVALPGDTAESGPPAPEPEEPTIAENLSNATAD